MALYAYSPSRDSAVGASDDVDDAVCRDPLCRTRMIAVSAQSMFIDDVPVILRRAHWRHHNPGGSTPCAMSSRKDMSDWHLDWQAECDDPERVDARVVVNGDVRYADILTKFGWALEFQHHSIAKSTVTKRERTHGGYVLWIVDAASRHDSGPMILNAGALEWTPSRWVTWIKTAVAIDTGKRIYLLPVGGLKRYRVGGDGMLRIPLASIVGYSRAEFAAAWINGDILPPYLGGRMQWQWELERAEAMAQRAQARQARDMPAASSPSGSCEYNGDGREPVMPVASAGQWRRAATMPAPARIPVAPPMPPVPPWKPQPQPAAVLAMPSRPAPPPRPVRQPKPCWQCGSGDVREYINYWACSEHTPTAMRGITVQPTRTAEETVA